MNLYERLHRYKEDGRCPMHMPGHKRNPLFSMENPYLLDVTEVDGCDNLHEPSGDIKELQEQMSRLYQTKESFLLVNGSTCGILAAISATCRRGDSILVARNCHRSVYHAIYLLELTPVYIMPEMDEQTGICMGCHPQKVKSLLERHPEVSAVVLTSPTYEGVCSDVEAVAEVVHRMDKVLIVDEAHGAHLRWMNDHPAAETAGADLVVQSLHKTLPALTQTGVLHRCSERVSGDRIARYLDIYETSSPSYILMASVAQCMDWLWNQGEAQFDIYKKRLQQAEKEAGKWKYLRLWACKEKEPSKLVIDTGRTTWSGVELARILRDEYAIETEMAASDYIVAMTSVADTEENFLQFFLALEQIDAQAVPSERKKKNLLLAEPKVRHSSYEAVNGAGRAVPLREAAGKISAEYVMVYPPGIPFVAPGEEIDHPTILYIEQAKKDGLHLTGPRDKKIDTLIVYEQ